MAIQQRLIGLAGAIALLLCAGCKPANRYDVSTHRLPGAAPYAAREPKETAKEHEEKQPPPPPPIPPEYAWKEPAANVAEVPIEFISADQEEWAKLGHFWNEVQGPGPAQLGASAGSVLPGVPLVVTTRVQLKVPLGLDNPTRFIPAENRPTLAKWKLGKQLFFDTSYLTPGGRVSCATCHAPAHNFTRGRDSAATIAGMDTPTLLNVVYNRYQFWDGRARYLEEVVQRTLEDEREPEIGHDHPHVWSGVIKRLQDPAREHTKRFQDVFGTPPTQDALGKALATFMRTILSGNSVHDRALQVLKARGGTTLELADYQQILDLAALDALGSDAAHKDEIARDLHTGYRLFHDPRKANCVSCHSGRNFTDETFHNLGVGWTRQVSEPGRELGHFAALPIGLKDRRFIGAYKTPTLRGLWLTAPYLHDGSVMTLPAAVGLHLGGGGVNNPYLDPEMRDEKDPSAQRVIKLDEKEIAALVLFLRALNGEALSAMVTDPAK
jgi:cytochrome c peroxidase